MTAEQLALLQAVEKGRVLLETVDVVDLEVRADGERVDGKTSVPRSISGSLGSGFMAAP